MDMDEDDDFYGDGGNGEEGQAKTEEPREQTDGNNQTMQDAQDQVAGEEDDEEDEEEDDDDSDIDIITERKDGTKAPPPSNARYNEIRNIPQRTGSSEIITKQAAIKKDATALPKTSIPVDSNGADLPGLAISTIDVDAKPIYDPAGKPITQVNIDADLPSDAKPWRQPGTDITDFFNYGFDEFTWALYAAKQDQIRGEYDSDKIAANQKKMMEDMNMLMMGGMPGAAMGVMGGPGMEGMPPDMQQMMQMMAQGGAGGDMSGMDPNLMMQLMGQQGAQQGFGGPPQGFGQAGGFPGGFDQNNNNIGGGGGRGNFRGRGRGHRGW